MYGCYDKKNWNLIILKILWEHTDDGTERFAGKSEGCSG